MGPTTAKKVPWSTTASAISGIAGVVALAFGAWFTFTNLVDDAVGMEAKTRELEDTSLRHQNLADDIDFEIWRVDNAMDRIERRQANGIKYQSDEERMKGLVRELDILLKRQNILLERLESQLKSLSK